MKETEQLIKELWSLWESMAECGELHIGPKFSKEYADLKLRVEQNLNIHSVMLSGWQACPKCHGQGIVSKPPYLAGDINHWSDSQGQHECNVCKGKMIINIATSFPPDSY